MVSYQENRYNLTLFVISPNGLQRHGGNFGDVLYLNFSKALNRVPKRRLLVKLECMGISGKLLR